MSPRPVPAELLALPRTQVCGEDKVVSQNPPDSRFLLKSGRPKESPELELKGPVARGDPSTDRTTGLRLRNTLDLQSLTDEGEAGAMELSAEGSQTRHTTHVCR